METSEMDKLNWSAHILFAFQKKIELYKKAQNIIQRLYNFASLMSKNHYKAAMNARK